MFKKILIANRGEIACRVIKTAREMGIQTVAIYSDADRNALHVRMADEAIHIGPSPANESYIVIERVMDAIRRSGAEAVHPGYGFLSENASFAEALEAEGVAFIGPPTGAIKAMGDKITSKKIAQEAGVSTVPGYMGLIADAEEAVKISNQVGYPVMLKASAGGGGKGMRIAWNDVEAREGEQAVALAQAVDYASAGTVEFIVDGDRNFYFLEMNTRLQVEHPVTELITGVDLVEQMIRIANGEKLTIAQSDVKLNGWAIESRLYAEDPYRNFLPSIGRLTRYRPPQALAVEGAVVRNDTGVFEGGEISMFYDPMIAKLCTWAPTRAEAIEGMRNALDAFEVEGIGHNLPFLSAVMDHPKFVSGDITTAFIAEEYPDGFDGVSLPDAALRRIAASCAAMHRVAEIRRTRLSGRMDNHERHVGDDWVVTLQDQAHSVTIDAYPGGATVRFADGGAVKVTSDWTPGDQLATLDVDGVPLVLKVGKVSGGFRIRSRGADMIVHVRTPRQAELAALMPEKLPPDTSRLLLCPMPGLVVSVSVVVGDEVQEGQSLCTIEAMKMENILRAERKAVVTRINAGPGDSLAVDEIIMEFE